MRKIFALALALVLTMGLSSTALAAWTAQGAGSGLTAAASVGALSSVSASASGATVTVSWSTVTMPDGSPVDGYRVIRDGVPAGGTCGAYVDPVGQSCSEDLSNGTYTYRVAARKGAQWVGPEVADSVTVQVTTTVLMSTEIQLTADPTGPGNQWASEADIRVVDGLDSPVVGAQVVTDWGSCSTGSDGWCTNTLTKGGDASKDRTITITSVTASGYSWTGSDASATHSRP